MTFNDYTITRLHYVDESCYRVAQMFRVYCTFSDCSPNDKIRTLASVLGTSFPTLDGTSLAKSSGGKCVTGPVSVRPNPENK